MILSGKSSARSIIIKYGDDKKPEQNYAVIAIKNPDGSISLEEGHVDTLLKREKELVKDLSDLNAIYWLMFLIMIVYIGLFVLAIANHLSIRIILALLVFLVGSYMPLSVLIGLFFNTYTTKEAHLSFLRCHASEHKVINAFLKHSRIPTLNEVRAASRIHRECGCVDAGNNLTFALLISLGIALFPFLGFFRTVGCVLAGMALFFVLTAINLNPWRVFEYRSTKEPTELELTMALKATERLLIRLDEGICIRDSYDKDWSLPKD